MRTREILKNIHLDTDDFAIKGIFEEVLNSSEYKCPILHLIELLEALQPFSDDIYKIDGWIEAKYINNNSVDKRIINRVCDLLGDKQNVYIAPLSMMCGNI